MKKVLLLSLFQFATLNAICQTTPWTIMPESQIALLPTYAYYLGYNPYEFKVFTLDIPALNTQLSIAPMDTATDSNVILKFPNPDGGQDTYKIFEAAMMEQALANNYPNLKSYIGKSINDRTQTIRFSVTPQGFDAVTYSGKVGSFFIKKYRNNLITTYIVYKFSKTAPNPVFKHSESPATNFDFECGVNNENEQFVNEKLKKTPNSVQKIADRKLRIFRLAVATTVECSATIIAEAGLSTGTIAQKKGAVIAALVRMFTRLNCDWERDLSIRVKLVANQESIIFIDSDNFTNNNMFTLLDESSQITPIIGNSNFDIGHVIGSGGAGVASVGAISNDDAKTRSISQYDGNGITNDAFIFIVAHEMGHYFGATHTYSADNCPNVDDSSKIEPYAGATYVSYARRCSNIAPFSEGWQPVGDPYYHTLSIAQIQNVLAYTNSGTSTIINNEPPVINAGLDYIIPKDTPYVLKATVSNSNSDGYVYSWEGLDTGAQLETSATATSGPNFYFIQPTDSPNRFMPALEKVISGNLNNKMERLSSVSRVQNFAVTVRDNAVIGGSNVRRDDMKLTVNADAGPFVVTSQNSIGVIWAANSLQTITWNVAGTTTNNINTSLVNILLSTDKGLTFTTTLLANTPNDGSQVITVPNNINSLNCRLMVQSVGNLFYAVNTTKFAIATSLLTNEFNFENFVLYPNPNTGSFKISFITNNTEEVKITVNDIRGRNVFKETFQNNKVFNQEITFDKAQSGVYFVIIQNGEMKNVKRIIIE